MQDFFIDKHTLRIIGSIHNQIQITDKGKIQIISSLVKCCSISVHRRIIIS